MKNILIYNSGGGLGDSIQLFNLVTSLKTNFEDASLKFIFKLETRSNNWMLSPSPPPEL